MSRMGREDIWLSGGYGPDGGFDPQRDQIVKRAIEVSMIPVYCTKSADHGPFRFIDISRSEDCPTCGADVFVKQQIPSNVFRKAPEPDEDDALPRGKRPVTEDTKMAQKAWDSEVAQSFDTGEPGPFSTKRKNRFPWVGDR